MAHNERTLTDAEFAETIFAKVGAVNKKCRYCGAYLHRSTLDGGLLCLNGCELPHGLMVKFNAEIGAIHRRVQAQYEEQRQYHVQQRHQEIEPVKCQDPECVRIRGYPS